ncbi:MAG: LLM class F420-dependent oxidoreductase [Chloroflexota bacterium]|nr:LLM class F420-dependent oxidoreductase [Chloroflexota bacterium]
MQIGVTYPQLELGADPAAIRDFAQAAEQAGYDYLLAYDHVLGADPSKHDLSGPYTHESLFHEPFVLFGYMAGLTERIELVTGIIILPQRQTALVAKQAAEVDILSGGRLTLGIGIGWNQVEYEGLGQDFRTRGRRSEEQVQLLRRLWEEPLVTFEGEFDTIRDAGIHPRPNRRIPIWFGGGADSVLRRIGRYGDGWLTLGGNTAEQRADLVARFDRAREYAREAGRDADAIALIGRAEAGLGPVDHQLGQAAAWQDSGATHVTLNTMNAGFTSPQQHIDAITAFAEAYRRDA